MNCGEDSAFTMLTLSFKLMKLNSSVNSVGKNVNTMNPNTHGDMNKMDHPISRRLAGVILRNADNPGSFGMFVNSSDMVALLVFF